MTVKELLIAARARITDPATWTRKTLARDATGYPCRAHSDEAVAWCALGSLHIPDTDVKDQMNAYDRLKIVADGMGGGVVYVNDVLGHDTVLQMFDLAIEKAT